MLKVIDGLLLSITREGMARFAQMVIEQSQEIDLQLKKLLRTI